MGLIKKGLTAFQLKIFALVIMTVDHIAAFKIAPMTNDIYMLMRVTGRIAAPLFLFLLTEGIRHTKNRAKYILRLYIAGVIMQILREILVSAPLGNIFQTFFYTALYITCADKIVKIIKPKSQSGKIIFRPEYFIYLSVISVIAHTQASGRAKIFLNIFFPSPFEAEYSFLFVLLGVTWYFINNKKINCAVFACLSVICGLFESRAGGGFTFWHLFTSAQWYMILAVPFILIYNGKKGRGGLKYLFYVYYPAHQILFALLGAYF